MKLAQRLALATFVLTVALIGLGAYVRATGSGLGCPDWPTCHGGIIPPGSRHPLIEFSHRFTGTVVGLLVIATAIAAWKFYRNVPIAVWSATIAVPLVGVQGFLGAITVWRELPPEIVASHLLTAMVVLTFELVAFFAMYLEDPARRGRLREIADAPTRLPGKLSIVATGWFAGLLWIGGYMAESGASTSCSGWPLCNGSVLPANDDQEITHMLHRYLAGLFVFIIVPLVVVMWRRRDEIFWARPLALAVGGLFALEVMVGAFNVWYTFPDLLTVAHTVIASCLWSALSSAAILTYYAAAPERRALPLTKATA